MSKIVEEDKKRTEDEVVEEGIGDALRDVTSGARKAIAGVSDPVQALQNRIEKIDFKKINTNMVDGMKQLTNSDVGKELQATFFNYIFSKGTETKKLKKTDKELLRYFARALVPDLDPNKIGDVKDANYREFVDLIFNESFFNTKTMNTMMSRFKAYQSSPAFASKVKENSGDIFQAMRATGELTETATDASGVDAELDKEITKLLSDNETKLIKSASTFFKAGEAFDIIEEKLYKSIYKKLKQSSVDISSIVEPAGLKIYVEDEVNEILTEAENKSKASAE